MIRRLFECTLTSYNITPYQAKITDLKPLLREGEIDDLVKMKFNISNCGSLDEPIKIKGSESLLRGFDLIDCKKMDINEKLQNIRFVNFKENDIVLRFLPTKENGDVSELQASGIYSFTKEFLDYHFQLWNFSRFCFDNDHQDILHTNLIELLRRIKNNRRQYRLIQKDDEYFIRAMTSNRYKKYDNHLALYLALYSLHQFAKLENINFQVEKAYLTDSEIYLFVEQENPYLLKGFGKLYFGILIQNNELANGAFSIKFRYRLVNNENRSFGGILENEVISIFHSLGIVKVDEKLDKLYKFKEVRSRFLRLIHTIRKTPFLSENQLYKVFSKIIKSRTAFSKETKENAVLLKETIENTYTIIEVFDRVNEITSDIEEKLYLERLFNDTLHEHFESLRKREL